MLLDISSESKIRHPRRQFWYLYYMNVCCNSFLQLQTVLNILANSFDQLLFFNLTKVFTNCTYTFAQTKEIHQSNFCGFLVLELVQIKICATHKNSYPKNSWLLNSIYQTIEYGLCSTYNRNNNKSCFL